MRVLAIIPCYNEGPNLKETVESLKAGAPGIDFIVVDDGSSDNTADVCADSGYPVIRLPFNLGLANAVRTGMRYAFNGGYEMALQFDGDGQHLPGYIPQMILLMTGNSADIVVGSRYMQEKPRGLRGFGGKCLSTAIKAATGKTITDPTSGMRLYNRQMIEKFAGQINFGPEPDTLAYLIKRGAKVLETPVTMAGRKAGKSYLTALGSINYMIRMIVSILIIHWFREEGRY